MSVASPGPNVDEPVMIETTKQTNDYHEHEELDFEEEFDSDRVDITKLKNKPDNGDNDEEGELSTLDDEMKESEKSENDDNNKDDDNNDNNDNNDTAKNEDLEEGEILSDDEPESNTKDVPKLQFIRNDEQSLFSMNNRHYNNRGGGGYRQNRWQSDLNIIPRNRHQPPLLRNVNPSQYVLRPMPSTMAESTWEASCKQAQDIITLATRGGTDRESNGARFESSTRRQRSISPTARDDVGAKRRRRSPSSEDEVERRHRLAFETAPWNSSRGERPPPPLASRNREDNFSFRDGRSDDRPYPRRSDPNGEIAALSSRIDSRRRSRYSPDELHSSSSHSSYESRKFHPNTRGTPERRLPYERPSYEERSRYVEKNDSIREKSSSSGLASSGRLDRIPKKYSITNDGLNLRSKSVASDKSFDSWSESLSDSSSSYFTDSDSKQQKKKKREKKTLKKKKKDSKKDKLDSRRHRTLSRDRRSDSERKRSKSISPNAVKKVETKEPIKMQFMKKAGNFLQKSSLIRDDFVLSDDDLPDFETAEAMVAEKKPSENHHHHHHQSQQSHQDKNDIERLDSNIDDDDDDENDDSTEAEDFLTEEERRDIEKKLEIINQKIDNRINSHKN